MSTPNKSIHRATISLDVPTKIADVLLYANNVAQKMTNKPRVPHAHADDRRAHRGRQRPALRRDGGALAGRAGPESERDGERPRDGGAPRPRGLGSPAGRALLTAIRGDTDAGGCGL